MYLFLSIFISLSCIYPSHDIDPNLILTKLSTTMLEVVKYDLVVANAMPALPLFHKVNLEGTRKKEMRRKSERGKRKEIILDNSLNSKHIKAKKK